MRDTIIRMPLKPGDRVGPYEILGLLGKGGMGEVYRARDPRLQRDVAIKTSSQRFSERFDREARAIAALNHPNICQIYDVGPDYLVMEFVDGASLKGPLPLDETLRVADQIIAALQAAHEKGITHRDLKPGNILMRKDGVVKVLDFGLAKFGGTPTTPASAGDDSPTLSMAMTQAGMILGTAAYMAPEQARGKPVDNRADIWAFGVVVHELLTGERLFKGEDLTETLASVVKEKPDLSVVPRQLRRMLTACLEKDPSKRLQSIGDARLLLESHEEPAPTAVAPVVQQPRMPWLWPAAATLLAVAAGVALWAPWREVPPEPQSVHFSVEPPPGERFANQYGAFSVSPDGRHVAYVSLGKNAPSLWVRSLDSMTARQIPATTGANFSFWSPDSKSLAFTSQSEGKLFRVDIAGGAPLVLADVPTADPGVTNSGTWNAQGVILYGSGTGLFRVSAAGGGSTPLTKVDAKLKETGHGFPQFLPDGKRFLYFAASSDPNVQGIYASSLDNPNQRTLLFRTDAKAVYVPARGSTPGYLLWMQENNLVAQRFDETSLERQGDPLTVAANVSRNPTNPVRAAFWASDAGLLGYLSGAAQDVRRIVWMSRDGKNLGDALPEGPNVQPVLSLDGTRVALQRRENSGDITVWEFARSVSTRLTFDALRESTPIWSPDGKQIAYSIEGKGIYRKDSSGAGQPQLLLEASDALQTLDWSHDGKYILYRTATGETSRDIWAIPMDSGGKPFPVVVAPSNQSTARFSPDGKWVAYNSNESGTNELFIQPFVPPGAVNPGGRWQVSNSPAVNPVWRKDGRELYYDNASGEIVAVTVEPDGTALKVGIPRVLFKSGIDVNSLHSFDATGDGQKFLLQLAPTTTSGASALNVVTNWQAALKR